MLLRLASAASACLVVAAPLLAQFPDPVLPPHFTAEVVATQLDAPVDLLPLGGGRMLVASQSGVVRAYKDGALENVVLDMWAEVGSFSDRGVVSIAAHPGFVPDGGPTSWIYVLYDAGKDQLNGLNDEYALGRLTRYRVDEVQEGAKLVLKAIPSSRQVLLGEQLPDGTAPTAIPLLHESHQGGTILFGTDGTLLVSTGEGADIGVWDPGGLHPGGFDDFVHPVSGLKGPYPKSQDIGTFRSQYLDSLAGKVLRLDPETGLGVPSNPYYDGDPASLRSRVWAFGLRNPFRMARVPGTGVADPAAGEPGWLVIADVGSTTWEEISLAKGGENFGWPCFEGPSASSFANNHVFPPNPYGWPSCATPAAPHTPPLVAIRRDSPAGLFPLDKHQTLDGQPLGGFLGLCIIGGVFYEGTSYPPAWRERFLFADFGFEWLRALDLTQDGQVEHIADFGELFTTIDTIRADPDTGDLLILQRGFTVGTGRILALRYGANTLPDAVFDATLSAGGGPLAFDFDASATTDPDGDPLTFTWDFGDGSPTASGPTVSHTYASPGLVHVTLTVGDGFGTSTVQQPLLPGVTQPTLVVGSPRQGQTFEPGETLLLTGAGADGQGGMLDLAWKVDLFLEGAWIDGIAILPGATAQFATFEPALSSSDHGYRITLFGIDGGQPVAQQSVYVHPAARVRDVTGPALFEAKVLTLSPPGSQGFGNADIEVLRDLDQPLPGADPSQQYATFHPASAGAGPFDWFGYRFGPHHPPAARVFAIELQEGAHVPEGGWFRTAPIVQVLVGGQWVAATGVQVDPPYVANTSGTGFGSHRFTFDPVEAEGVRLIGRPGGTIGFLSAAELRVFAAAPIEAWRDVTHLAAAPISSLDGLVPSGPQGFGASDLEKLRDGAEPAPASTSVLAQVSSFHPAASTTEAWFGWRFDEPTVLLGVRFREGLVWSSGSTELGGWLETLAVETRLAPGAPWVPVPNALVTPPYRTVGPGTPDYEAWTVAFEPLVAREVRVVGAPGGNAAFATASELRVFGPHAIDASWTVRAGLGLPADVLALGSSTPPALGLPVLLEVVGAPAGMPGALGLALSPFTVPFLGGTLLIDPTAPLLLPLAFDAAGVASFQLTLPQAPEFAFLPFSLQALAVDPSQPAGIAFSNALDGVIGLP